MAASKAEVLETSHSKNAGIPKHMQESKGNTDSNPLKMKALKQPHMEGGQSQTSNEGGDKQHFHVLNNKGSLDKQSTIRYRMAIEPIRLKSGHD